MDKNSEKNEINNVSRSNADDIKLGKTKKHTTRSVIVCIFCVLSFLSICIMYRGNYLEVLEIGKQYISAFSSNVKYKLITIVVSFLWVYFLMYTTNKRIKNGMRIFFQEEKKEMPKFPNKSISFITATIVSIITSNVFLQKVILFVNNTSFGKSDYAYGHDIGYYLFIQPFIQSIIIYLLITIALATLYAAIYYIILINTQFKAGVSSDTLKKSIIKKQLFNNARIVVILIAVLTCVNAENLSSQTFLTVGDSGNTYSLVGAGVTDINIKVWGYRGLSVLMVLAIFIAIPAYYKQKNRRLFIWIASVPVYLVALIVVLIGYDKLFVNSNEYEKEKKYIAYNIENTREAYGVNVEEIKVNDQGTITSDEINYNSLIAQNINLNNKDQVLNLLNGTLTNKGQYKFSSTNLGVYNINGKDTLVYLTPREIVSADKAYANSTYENTHGYGVVVTSASQVDAGGSLINLQKDFSSDMNVINISNPRIYFGLETNKTVVTNSKKITELDYPIEGTDGATNSYDGNAGLKLNALDKIILGLSKGDINLTFSKGLSSNSKILTNRNIIDRAKKVMPYLMYDKSPYLVATDGGDLVWVLDAYTTSKYYPYSQKTNVDGQEINYIKNSVKVLIDAYDGDVKFYITDRTDPVAMAYQKAFPKLFMELDEKIPEDISKYFNYSQYLYSIQTEILKRYHNTETDVIYRANDIWDIAKYGSGIKASDEQTVEVKPYYSIIKTKENAECNLGIIIPYTMYGKQSLTAYAVGSYKNGAAKLNVYRYRADNAMIGPIQLDTEVSQNEEIYREIENLDVSGTKITKNIALIPINNKMIYVESIFQEYLNESNSLPKLKKVIVASGNKIAIGDSAESALKNLISQGYDIEIENYENKDEIIKSIIKANKNLKESTSNSNYEMIGKDINRLQSLIDQLEIIEKKEEIEKNKQDIIKTESDENKTL